MNRTAIAILVAATAIPMILFGAYEAFFALSSHFGAGRTLGLISAALMVASGLACAGVVYLAKTWLKHAERDR